MLKAVWFLSSQLVELPWLSLIWFRSYNHSVGKWFWEVEKVEITDDCSSFSYATTMSPSSCFLFAKTFLVRKRNNWNVCGLITPSALDVIWQFSSNLQGSSELKQEAVMVTRMQCLLRGFSSSCCATRTTWVTSTLKLVYWLTVDVKMDAMAYSYYCKGCEAVKVFIGWE